ncbi:unnamed protein product [Protopolystoma xenopodis]|uniref:Uncharacterized protein n=1 Tax=Protopolystoma xenopodis TaxID=117903 RepID=A0A3S5C4V2_9PLAT|nr:unnamed protein product [Protopolystoma xenopodis]
MDTCISNDVIADNYVVVDYNESVDGDDVAFDNEDSSAINDGVVQCDICREDQDHDHDDNAFAVFAIVNLVLAVGDDANLLDVGYLRVAEMPSCLPCAQLACLSLACCIVTESGVPTLASLRPTPLKLEMLISRDTLLFIPQFNFNLFVPFIWPRLHSVCHACTQAPITLSSLPLRPRPACLGTQMRADVSKSRVYYRLATSSLHPLSSPDRTLSLTHTHKRKPTSGCRADRLCPRLGGWPVTSRHSEANRALFNSSAGWRHNRPPATGD